MYLQCTVSTQISGVIRYIVTPYEKPEFDYVNINEVIPKINGLRYYLKKLIPSSSGGGSSDFDVVEHMTIWNHNYYD